MKPDAPSCHIVHAEILRATGRSDAAKASIARAYQVRPDLNEALVRTIFPYRDRSIPDRLVMLLGMS